MTFGSSSSTLQTSNHLHIHGPRHLTFDRRQTGTFFHNSVNMVAEHAASAFRECLCFSDYGGSCQGSQGCSFGGGFLRGSVNGSRTSTCHGLSSRLPKCPRPQAETEPHSVRRNRVLMFPCRKWRNSWWKCRRPFPKTESSGGLWSRSLTLQSRRLWRNWQKFSGFLPGQDFNNVAVEQTIDNPATSLAEMIVEVPVVQTEQGVTTHGSTRSSTQSKWRSPKLSRRQCRERSPSSRRKSIR